MSDKYLTGIKVPHWVRWIAVDGDGVEYGYRNKPEPLEDEYANWWSETGEFHEGKDSILLTEGEPPKNFKEELYKWE